MVLKKEITLQIKNLLKENPQGLRITDIVKKVDINRNTAGRYLENLLVSGQVEMRRFGMAKIYSLSQRVPLSALLSISSELVIQLDSSLRIIFANEPFILLVGTDSKSLVGKNIEYTPVALVFEDFFPEFIEHLMEGVSGKEWVGEISLRLKDITLFCRIAPTVFDDGRKGVSIIFEDITEKKLAEKTLQNSEMQYRSLVETTGTGYVIVDNNGRVITANQEYVRLTGRSTLAEIEGRAVTDWTAPYDLERNAREIEKCFRRGQVRDLEIDYQRPDHTIQPIEVNASVIQSNSGKIILTLCRDITQRKEAEQKVEESERQFRLLAENSLDMISRIKPDGTRIYVSPAYKTTLGYEQEELIGKGNDEFIHPRDAHVMESLRNILTHENPSATVIFRTKHKDGHYIWIESAVKAIFDETTGELSEYYTVTRDITQRKKEQELLQESEERYRTLVEISPDPVIIHQQGKIFLLNPAALRLLGVSHNDEIIGKNVLDFIQPDFREEVRKNIQKDLDGEETPSLELKMLRLDGTTILVEGKGVKTNIDGKPAIQVALKDITKSKRAEEELRESKGKLNAMLHSIPDLISMIDKDLTITWANEPAKRFFGNDIIGKKCYEAYHLRQAPCEPYPCLTLKAFLDGKTHQHETTVIDSQGENRFFECTATVALRDNSGKPVAVLETSRDITDKKKAESALCDSEEKYRTLIERANDVICIIQDGIIKMCNPRLPEFWGGSIEEIIGKPISEFIHPDALTEVVDHYNRRVAGEIPPSIYETILMRKDGSKSYVEVNAGIITYEGKNADLVIVRDINERKNATQALYESEEKYRSLVTTTGDIIWETDDKARFIFVSPQVESIIGFKPDELIGHTPFEFLKPDTIEPNQKRFRMTVDNREKSIIYISHWIHKNGHSVYLESHAVPVYRSDGSFSGFIGIDRKKML
jgi:PAS domain S-box-containing protein